MPVKTPSVLLLTGALVTLALLLLLSTPTAKKAPAALPEVRHVTAIGEAEVKVKPDQALITLQVVQRSVSAATAEAAHRRQLQQFTLLLRETGAESVQIGQANLAELPEVVGGLSWSVTSEVRITQKDLSKVDDLVELALAEGARLQGVEYGLSSPETQVTKALSAALANAKSRAETVASGEGGTLGAPVTVEMLGAPDVEGESAEAVNLKLSVKVTFPM